MLVHNGTNLPARETPLLVGASCWTADGEAVRDTAKGGAGAAEQDRDGIDSEVLFPPVFAPHVKNFNDRHADLALVAASIEAEPAVASAIGALTNSRRDWSASVYVRSPDDVAVVHGAAARILDTDPAVVR